MKEQKEKKRKIETDKTDNKNNSLNMIKTKKRSSDLTDNELRKLNERIRLENEYNRLIKEYNNNKNTTNKVMKTIGKKILEPALIESSKNIVQDLLTSLGKTTNTEINRAYRKSLKDNK